MHVADYAAFRAAYDHFNAELFDGRLPQGGDVTFTLAVKANAHGYFSSNRFVDGFSGLVYHEIALNPDSNRRPLVDVLGTLAHEMVHLDQCLHGKPGRGRYHNEEWACMMDAIGLVPSSTGAPGGARTGDKVSHYPAEGGRFLVAAQILLATGWRFELARMPDEAKPKKPSSKVRYCCPVCDLKAWAKPAARFTCGDCDELMEAAEAAAA